MKTGAVNDLCHGYGVWDLFESGEWDFVQEKIDNQYGLNVFNYYMIKRRKKALVYKGGKYD